MSHVPLLCSQLGGSLLPGQQVAPTTLTQPWESTVMTWAACPALWTEFQVLYPGRIYSTICPLLPSIPDILRMLCLLLAFQKD